MRRFACLLIAGVPSLLAAQGFGVYEQGTCTMGRAGVAAAAPCADGSAIFFNPAGLAGLAGRRLSAGVTLIQAKGSFTDQFFAQETKLDNPLIPVPNAYFTYALSPKVTVGVGTYVPYGLETHWPTEGFQGRFLGYKTKIRSIYIQPTVGYQVHERLALGVGFAFITSRVELNQRVDLSQQFVPPSLGAVFAPPLPAGTRFAALGVPTGTDFADAHLEATGTGVAVNVGAILKLSDRLSIGGHWLTRKTIGYDGDAVFATVPTGLALPITLGTCPFCVPAGTRIDDLVLPLFARDSALDDGPASTEITMPPQGSIGLAYKVQDNWTVMADYHVVVWGWFNSIYLDFAKPRTPDITLYEGYKDTHGFRLGLEHRHGDKYTFRGGYLYHGGAAPPETVTPLLPEASRNEFTLGVGAALTPAFHADLGYQFIKQNDRRGRVHDPSVGNTGLYQFTAHLVALGLSYTF
jgi:long-chain fatty acid transport protein